MPATAEITIAGSPSRNASRRRSSSWAMSAARPVKRTTSGGSWRGTSTDEAVGRGSFSSFPKYWMVTSRPAATTSRSARICCPTGWSTLCSSDTDSPWLLPPNANYDISNLVTSTVAGGSQQGVEKVRRKSVRFFGSQPGKNVGDSFGCTEVHGARLDGNDRASDLAGQPAGVRHRGEHVFSLGKSSTGPLMSERLKPHGGTKAGVSSIQPSAEPSTASGKFSVHMAWAP